MNGIPKVVWSLPLGTAEDVVRVYQAKHLANLKFQTFDFGKVAALYSIAQELDFFDIVDTTVEKKDIGGLVPSQYLFLIIAGRAYAPISKSETGRWFHKTFLKLRWTIEHSLSCQNFLNHMDYLTRETMTRIEDNLGKKLVELGVTPTTLFWDTTNFSTCIENWGNRELPNPGYAKDKRFDRNLVGVGLAVSDDNIPLLHESYPGNEHDSTVLSRMVDRIVERLEMLRQNSNDVVLVFDQAGNTPDNIPKVLDRMHVIGCLKRNQVKDLMAVPLNDFKFLYKSNSGGNVYAHRVKRKLWDREFTVIVSFTKETAKRQERTWGKAKERIESGMRELAEKFSRESGRGRKMGLKGLTECIHELVPKQYRSLVKWDIDEGKRKLTWKIDETREKEFKLHFGKSVLFTDLHGWPTAKIVRTYRRKSLIEDDFRWLHGKLNLAVSPYYVRLDKRIRTHTFLCVLGLIFLRYMGRKLASLKVSPQRIWVELERLRVVLAKNIKTGESQFIVEEMNPIQAKAFEILGLAKFLSLNSN